MKIEVLFQEIFNLYGDLFNIKYLKDCLPEAEIVNTGLKEQPLFLTEKPDLIYMGTTTEQGQIMAIEALSKYKERIHRCIEDGVSFLITGNALEVFCKDIYEEDEKVADGLGILDLTARRKARKRFNSLYLGEFKAGEKESPIKIVGFKSVFGYAYGENYNNELFETERGDGLNPGVKGEGIRINNFFATYIIGPLLVLNPPFTRWFIKEALMCNSAEIAFSEAAENAYEDRVKEYSDPNTGFYY